MNDLHSSLHSSIYRVVLHKYTFVGSDHSLLYYLQWWQTNISAWSQVTTQNLLMLEVPLDSSQELPHPDYRCHAQCLISCRIQVLGNHPKAFLVLLIWSVSYHIFSSVLLHSTMGWMAQPVFSDKIPLWVFCQTHLRSFLWHIYILLQAASCPAEREEAMLNGLHF